MCWSTVKVMMNSALDDSAGRCSSVGTSLEPQIGQQRPRGRDERRLALEPDDVRGHFREHRREAAEAAADVVRAVDGRVRGGPVQVRRGRRAARGSCAAAPAARLTSTTSPGVQVLRSLIVQRRPHLHRRRELPAVARPVDADVLAARLHAERVEQPVVVVRIAVARVDRDVELVGALDEVEALDHEIALAACPRQLDRLQLRDVGVGAVAADAVGVEEPDAEGEVGAAAAAPDRRAESSSRSPDWNTWPAAPSSPMKVTPVISTSRDPQRPSVARNMSSGGGRGRRRIASAVTSARRRSSAHAPAPGHPTRPATALPRLLDVGDVGADDAPRIAVARAEPGVNPQRLVAEALDQAQRVRHEQDGLARAGGTRRTCRGTCA